MAAPGQALPPPGASSWSPAPSPTGCRQDWVPVPIAGTRCCPTAFIPWVWAHWVFPERPVPPSPPQPSALALSPQESRNPPRPRSGPPLKTSGISTGHTRRAAGGTTTPTAASGAWPGPPGAACSPCLCPQPLQRLEDWRKPLPCPAPQDRAAPQQGLLRLSKGLAPPGALWPFREGIAGFQEAFGRLWRESLPSSMAPILGAEGNSELRTPPTHG